MKFVGVYAVTICVSVLAACLVGWGGLTAQTALIALLIGGAAGLYAAKSCSAVKACPRSDRPRAFWEWFTVITFALFALRAFCWLIFQNGDSIKTLSPNNLGDLCLHLTYIRYLASGVPFWPDNPIFAAGKLHYPLGVDLFNSLLALRGVPVERGLIWMGLIGSLATGLALWRWGGAFAMAGFLFNGGLAGFAICESHRLADFQADLAWKSIPLSMFVTQRGLLYALPAGLLLLACWRARFFSENTAPRVPPWMELLLYSTMPLFHLHTFLFLSFLLAIWLILGVSRKEIFKLLACSVLPATLLVSQVAGFQGHNSLIHLKPGWMQDDQNFFLFWFLNFGILPLLMGILCVILVRQFPRRRTSALFVLPATALFVLSCFVMWAPWPWDNTKFMIWCYLAVLPFLWRDLVAPRPLPARILICGTLFFSGFISLLGGLDRSHTGYDIGRRTELASLASALKELPKEAVFAACPTWNHPLLLNGRKLAVGYDGHLWSHGIDYPSSMRRLDSLMMGNPDWLQAAAGLNIRYLFWGALEQEKYPGSSQPWKTISPCVAKDDWGAIYQLQPANSGDSHATRP